MWLLENRLSDATGVLRAVVHIYSVFNSGGLAAEPVTHEGGAGGSRDAAAVGEGVSVSDDQAAEGGVHTLLDQLPPVFVRLPTSWPLHNLETTEPINTMKSWLWVHLPAPHPAGQRGES